MTEKIQENKNNDNKAIIKIQNMYNKYKKIFQKRENSYDEYNKDFIETIKKAKKEWEQAKNYFSSVSDPDLVDYAVHKIEASKSFYSYLIKKAKSENIHTDL